jgi:hypothetical protein
VDGQGKVRAALAVTAEGPGQALLDAAAKTIWRAP